MWTSRCSSCSVPAWLAIVLSRSVIAAAKQQSVAGFYLFAALVMWMLALGPTVMFMGVPRACRDRSRLSSCCRAATACARRRRFWLMATLCLAIVAGLAASELLARRSRRAAMALTAVLAAGLLSDGWATIPAVPAPAAFPDQVALRGQTVLQLPVGDFHDFAPQFLAVAGGWRSVNGYSGYEPRFYEALRQGARFEVDGLFQPFRARGDLFVVVNDDQPRLRALVERQPGAVCIGDRNGHPAVPAAATDAGAHGARVRRRRCGSRASPRRVPRAPQRPSTGGSTRAGRVDRRTGDEWFQADLGAAADRVSAVRYSLGESYRDFPRALVVETSVDGQAWEPAWDGDVIAPTIEGSLAGSADGARDDRVCAAPGPLRPAAADRKRPQVMLGAARAGHPRRALTINSRKSD